MKSFRYVRASVFLLFAVLQGCKARTGNSSSGLKIFAGTVLGAEEFPTVGVLTFRFGEDNVSQFCTGTLIADDIVLTAAHCLAAGEFLRGGLEAESIEYLRAFASFKTEFMKEPVPIIKHWISPGYHKIDHNKKSIEVDLSYDIALAKLMYPIEEFRHYDRFPIARANLPTGDSSALYSIGYGRTRDDDEQPDGKKRVGKLTYAGFHTGQELKGDKKNGWAITFLKYSKPMYVGARISTGSAMICGGDSGGPVFILNDGHFELYGINSCSAQPPESLIERILGFQFDYKLANHCVYTDRAFFTSIPMFQSTLQYQMGFLSHNPKQVLKDAKSVEPSPEAEAPWL